MKFFVGFDDSRKEVFNYCTKSLSIDFSRIGSSLLSNDIWYRKRSETDSTEFSVCRFLVPYLSNYEGWSVFMDDDFYWKVSPNELEDFCDDRYSVLVCQHDYVPKNETKWGNLNQLKYDKKNWSSLMLFNNSHVDCKKLDIQFVNEELALALHQFQWTKSIGSLPLEYNFLVGEYENDKNAKALHYTNGLPCIK